MEKNEQELRRYLLKRLEDYCRGRLCSECDVRENCLSDDGRLGSQLPTSKLQELYCAMYPDMKGVLQMEKNEQVKIKVKTVEEMGEELRKACYHTSCRQCPLIDYTCSSLFDGSAGDDIVVKAYHERFSSPVVDFLHEETGRQLLEEVSNNQQAKADYGKPIFTWVPPAIIRAIERVRAFGNKKYHDPDNWRNVSPQRYWQAYLRHTIAAWWDFRKKDKESGLRHIDHCACNLAFIMQFLEEEEEANG